MPKATLGRASINFAVLPVPTKQKGSRRRARRLK
jgi:hypothetical protein